MCKITVKSPSLSSTRSAKHTVTRIKLLFFFKCKINSRNATCQVSFIFVTTALGTVRQNTEFGANLDY